MTKQEVIDQLSPTLPEYTMFTHSTVVRWTLPKNITISVGNVLLFVHYPNVDLSFPLELVHSIKFDLYKLRITTDNSIDLATILL